MGSEDFLKTGVASKALDSGQSVGVPIFGSPSIDSFNSLSLHKDEADATRASDSPSWNKNPHTSVETTLQREGVCKRLFLKSTNCPPLLIPGAAVKKLPQKFGRGSRNSNGSANKRMRVTPKKDSPNELLNDKFNKLDVSSNGCTFRDKSEVDNQKNNFSCKRCDKRNPKVPKFKHDSFSVKPGSVCFHASVDGLNALKSDVYDITMHEDEPPLDALLDGSYKVTSLGKTKGRKPSNLEDNVLQSVRKAFFILGLSRPENIPEPDTTSNPKMPACEIMSEPPIATPLDIDKGSPPNKNVDSDSSFRQPDIVNRVCHLKFVLERLALLPPVDFKSLLFETGETSVTSSRNGLPAFAWSYSSGGQHCKTNSESAGKSSASRSSCQVRWVRIRNIIKSGGVQTHGFADLGSLTFNQSLVPSTGKKLLHFQNQPTKSPSLCLPKSEPIPPASTATCSRDLQAAHSPRAVVAAETLIDIANSKWEVKEPLQRKAITTNNRKWIPSRSESEAAAMMNKRRGMGAFGKKRFMKGEMSWSNRAPPIKSLRKHLNGITKPSSSCKISPVLKRIARSSSSSCKISPISDSERQKMKKLVPMEWSRGKSRPG